MDDQSMDTLAREFREKVTVTSSDSRQKYKFGDWRRHKSKDPARRGKFFYQNARTKESTWLDPQSFTPELQTQYEEEIVGVRSQLHKVAKEIKQTLVNIEAMREKGADGTEVCWCAGLVSNALRSHSETRTAPDVLISVLVSGPFFACCFFYLYCCGWQCNQPAETVSCALLRSWPRRAALTLPDFVFVFHACVVNSCAVTRLRSAMV